MALSAYTYRFEPASVPGASTLLLLHGTGGNENDLVPVGRAVAPGAALLAPRGDVLEHGMPRFFRRLAEGVLDQADLERRTHALADWVGEAARAHGVDPARVVALGFSNGANIAASILLRRPGTLAGAILLRPMLPFDPGQAPDLSGCRVLVAAGRSDPLVPGEQSERLADILRRAGAEVTLHWSPGGHVLAREDLAAALAWWQAGGAGGRPVGG